MESRLSLSFVEESSKQKVNLTYEPLLPEEFEKSTAIFKQFAADILTYKKVIDAFPLNLVINSVSPKRQSYSFSVKAKLEAVIEMLKDAKTAITDTSEAVRVMVIDTSVPNAVHKIDAKKLETSSMNFIERVIKEKIEKGFMDTLDEIITLTSPRRKLKGEIYLDVARFQERGPEFTNLKTLATELNPDYFLMEGSLKVDIMHAFKQDFLLFSPIDKCFLAELIMNGFKMGHKVNVIFETTKKSSTFYPFNYITEGPTVVKPPHEVAKTDEFTLVTYYSSEYKEVYTSKSSYAQSNNGYLKGTESSANGGTIFEIIFPMR